MRAVITLVDKQCSPSLTEAGDLYFVYTAEAQPAYETIYLRKDSKRKPKEQWWNDGDNEARARVNGPTPLTDKQHATLDGMARRSEAVRRGGARGGATQRAMAERKLRDGMAALGDALMRYGRRELVAAEPITIAGKLRFQWRCDCGQTGTVPCTDWIRRGANFGTQCQTCSRKRFGSGSSLGATKEWRRAS